MPAVAMTDHGYLFGAYEFWSKARKHGHQADHRARGVRHARDPPHRPHPRQVGRRAHPAATTCPAGGAYTHMTLLAAHDAGHAQPLHDGLDRLARSGLRQVPRLDRELLNQYGDGLVATTGCPSGEVQIRLRLGQYDKAREAAAEFRDIFGAEHYFCELMDHGNSIERRVRDDLLRLAKDLRLPLLATNDLHYTRKEDAKAHGALLCVQSGSTLMDPNRFTFDGDGYYLKSPQEMRHLWRELPEACDNTLRVAERATSPSSRGRGATCPASPAPRARTRRPGSSRRSRRGCSGASPSGVPDDALKQAHYETEVIVAKGYPGYFLVVADFISWAKDNGIRVGPGRGSGAGSMCAYAMRHHRPRPAAARPDLRALPQPRARLDARLRRRLRRAPARRGHQVRHREVRRRARRADRHLRHDQGQAGASRTPAGSSATRSRWATS